MAQRISFATAVARAGSLEAVLARLRAGDVMAYHGGLYYKDNRPRRRKDDLIPVEWWKTAHDINPAASQVSFHLYVIDDNTIPIRAMEIVDASAANTLWPPEPEQSQSAPAETSAGMTELAEKMSAKGLSEACSAKPVQPAAPRLEKPILKHLKTITS